MMLNGRGGQGEKVEEVVFLAESLLIGACWGMGWVGGGGLGGGNEKQAPHITFPGVRLYCGFYSQGSKQSGESNLVRLAFLSQRKDRTLAQQEMEAGTLGNAEGETCLGLALESGKG